MLFVSTLLGFLLLQQPAAVAANCTGGVAGAADICLADREVAQGEAAQGADRIRHLETARELYREAALAANDPGTKIKALDAATRTLDVKHLNDPAALELILRELIGLAPNDLQFIFRLAAVQEEQGELQAAEDTLLAARHQQPQVLEPYKMLAQFYARRASAIFKQLADATGPPAVATDTPGAPDRDGIYRVGGSVEPAKRVENPIYPDDAQAAGISGAVQAEIVVSEQGTVTDAKILKSVPLLDEAALNVVRQWRFRPSIVNWMMSGVVASGPEGPPLRTSG